MNVIGHSQSRRPRIAIVMRAFNRPDYDVWLAASQAAEAQGITVVTYVGRAIESPEDLEAPANVVYELINPDRLDGAILLASGLGLYIGVAGMRTFCDGFAGCPLVSLQMTIPGVPSILVDSYRGMREVIDHLIEVHNYRRIAFLRGPVTHRGAEERYRAYRDALAVHGLPFDPELVKEPTKGWSDLPGLARFLTRLGGTAPAYDAIVSASAGHAEEALNWLQSQGVSVPDTVGLAGFDNFPMTAGMIPALTTADVDFDAMGRQAVALLVAQMRGEPVPETWVASPRLLVRESCGCPSRSLSIAGLPACAEPAVEAVPARDSAPVEPAGPAADRLWARRAALADAVLAAQDRCADLPSPDRVQGLVAALISDVTSPFVTPSSSAFLSALQEMLVRLVRADVDVGWVQDALSGLREAVADTLSAHAASGPGDAASGTTRWPADPTWPAVEQLLGQARVLVGETARRAAHAERMRSGQRMATLRQLGHTLTTVVDLEQLGETLMAQLPKIGIPGCYLALFEEPDDPTGWARLHFACCGEADSAMLGATTSREGLRFSAQNLLPVEVWTRMLSRSPGTLVVEPLHVRDEHFGFIVVEAGPRGLLFENQPDSGSVYDLLRGYISDAVHGILLYEDALRARQQAEEADRLKSRFLSMVSHELRTPLNLIVSLSEMLLWQQGGYQQELSRIHASAQHLDGLIRDVLDLASSQVGQLRLVREPLDLAQALSVVALIGEQMARDKGLAWRMEMPDALPKVWGDRTRLRQVALNLVSNALRFTSEGEVRLKVTADAGHVTIAVSDTGIGVPPAEQEIIFDEFQQSERTAARGYGGLGLGLAISRRLVEMHGGAIGVQSSGTEGEGATFFFTIPVMDAVARAPVGEDPARQATSQSDLAKRSVMLLSAQPGAGQSLRDYLSARGYTVKEFPYSRERSPDDPEHWLNQVLLTMPGAVILDAEPAKEHGWTLMRLLKENPETQNTPVLFYSLLQEEDSGSMLALDYLSKPVSMDDIVNVLDRQGLTARAKQLAASEQSCGDRSGDKICSSFTFLVVDDNPNVVATHTWLLQSQMPNSRILQASNGRQALDVMRRTRPDLVLLDLMMPELSGFDVLSEMQQDPDLNDIPVVVLTAKSLTHEAISRLTKGVTAVLGKGLFSAEETLARVETALRVDRGTAVETQEIVRQAMVYLHEHYTEALTRKDVARHVNLSARHLDRCFCEETGITPMTYLNRFRLRQAKRLLQNSTLNIGEIAAAVGFSDSAYFSRVFRRDMGMSPTDYRRTNN